VSADAYAEIDSSAAPAAFTRALADPTTGVRLSALDALAALGERAAESVPTVVRLLQDSDETVQARAAATLDKIGTPEASKELEVFTQKQLVRRVSGLIRELRRSPAEINISAVQSLVTIGTATLPMVQPVLKDTVPAARAGAAQVLKGLGSRAIPATEALKAALDDSHHMVRMEAAAALAAIGTPEAQKALQYFSWLERYRQLRDLLLRRP
jgi:HEAT repeat protein